MSRHREFAAIVLEEETDAEDRIRLAVGLNVGAAHERRPSGGFEMQIAVRACRAEERYRRNGLNNEPRPLLDLRRNRDANAALARLRRGFLGEIKHLRQQGRRTAVLAILDAAIGRRMGGNRP